MKGKQTQLKELSGDGKSLLKIPTQKVGEIRVKFTSPIVRKMRASKQKLEWYHRNKDWVGPKRNEMRREMRAAKKKGRQNER